MSEYTSIEDIKKLGTILGIWAHPDDESYETCGIMAAAVKNGQKVVCITATRGEKGSVDEAKWPSATLGQLRTEELENAMRIIGVQKHYWLNYIDGECHKINDDEAVSKILEIIHKHKPDTIITFSPDGHTGHLDHVAVSRWSTKAVAEYDLPVRLFYDAITRDQHDNLYRELDKKFNIYFNIDKPTLLEKSECDMVFKLTPELAEIKHQALKVMTSQTEGLFASYPWEKLVNGLGYEVLVSAEKPIIWGTPKT